ncbi:MAG: thiamine pyrophosphate-binding protein [Candidatus Lokiarchaeota archaeon]|nr:thiamine pyrophosphate-binding protein [Candidatus Lokiarchaeota archaeon]MBD3338219.1 thiamine pyrophosphate-binding protein [Candidatus Lokiarchaeota archaeon]
MPKQLLNGGDLLVKTLLKNGVNYIFGITGGELLKIYDAIHRFGTDEGITTIMVRHEQGGAHAADGYARTTGKLGVCMGTVGPGVMHLVPGIASAYADSIPVLAIGAQVGKMFENTGIIQGCIDQVSMMKPITKLQLSVEEPTEIPDAVQLAIKTALTNRPGPVYLELRETALVRETDDSSLIKILEPKAYMPANRIAGEEDKIEKAITLLKESEKPLIIAGGGVKASFAFDEIKTLSKSYSIPAGTTVNAVGSISSDTNTFVGSYLSSSSLRSAASNADLVLSFGCKWDYTTLFGAPPIWSQTQKIVQVDIDPSEIGKNRPATIGIVGDCKEVLRQLLEKMEVDLPKVKIEEYSSWNKYLQEFKQVDEKQAQKFLKSDKIPIRPQRLVLEVFEFFPSETIFSIDGGDIMVFSILYLNHTPRSPRSVLFAAGMGHLGTGIPYAVGAKLAEPDKPVVCICGDGSFLFNAQELDTAVRYELPIICVVSNNSCWGMIKGNQKINYKKRYCDVELPQTNYADIAESYGCLGIKVKEPDQIRPALQKAINSNRPTVIDVDVGYEDSPAIRLMTLYKKQKGLYRTK